MLYDNNDDVTVDGRVYKVAKCFGHKKDCLMKIKCVHCAVEQSVSQFDVCREVVAHNFVCIIVFLLEKQKEGEKERAFTFTHVSHFLYDR